MTSPFAIITKLAMPFAFFGIVCVPVLSQADGTADAKEARLSCLLNEARDFQQTARFDLAKKRYHAVLELDPENTDARAGEQQVDAVLAQISPVVIRPTQELYYPVYPARRVGVSGKPSK